MAKNVATVHSHILVGIFLSPMRISLHEYEGSAISISIVSFRRNQRALRLKDALEAAESAESAVKPSAEGFANGACEL